MSVDGNATIQYFERNQFIGECKIYCCGFAQSSGDRRSAYWPNLAYFCPHCGEIWARGIYQFEFQYDPIPTTSWAVESRRCPEHGDGFLLIGKESLLPFCSPSLLHREAFLHCLKGPIPS